MRRLLSLLASIVWVYGPAAFGHDISQGHTPNWDPPEPTQEQREASAEVNALRYVIDRYKLWRTGTHLTVCFFEGAPEVRHAVSEIARAWTQYAHVTFDFGPEPALRSCEPTAPSHIRIAFQKRGNWSYVGRDSVAAELDRPSMNLEVASGVPLALVEPHELQRVVLHEFGHALGLQHEHQSPKSGCEAQFNWNVVYAEMAKPPNNWAKKMVDDNLKALVESPRLEISPYDPTSIMHYSLPSWMFSDGQKAKCFVAPNEALSKLDELGAEAAYPGTFDAQARYLDTLDRATTQTFSDRQTPPYVVKGVADQINSALAAAQAFPGRSFVCAQNGSVAAGRDANNNTIIFNGSAPTSASSGTMSCGDTAK
jgi:Astacin (Peptidase family M12A)